MADQFVLMVTSGEAFVCHQCNAKHTGGDYQVLRRRGLQLQFTDRMCVSCWARWTYQRGLILAPTMPPVSPAQAMLPLEEWRSE